LLHKTLIALAAAAALGCVPVATNALAAGHPGAHAVGHPMRGHAMAGFHRRGHRAGFARGGRVARYGRGYGNGPIYDSCAGYGYGYGYGPGYGYNGCPGNAAPFVGGVINGIFGGYGPY